MCFWLLNFRKSELSGMLKLFETQDGSVSVFSQEYGVSYHSKYGAVQESRHVFIEAGLFLSAILKKELRILEMGFGTGLNAFLTYLEARKLGLKIDYTAVEAYPLDASFFSKLNYPARLQAEAEQFIFEGLHTAAWNEEVALSNFFSITKIRETFQEVALAPQFDLVYFDAFAPNTQPELWEAALMQKMYGCLLPGGVLVTYCAQGAFKRTLKAAGFEVETLKGPPGKREMTRAIKP